jgi:hypothetical protein
MQPHPSNEVTADVRVETFDQPPPSIIALKKALMFPKLEI